MVKMKLLRTFTSSSKLTVCGSKLPASPIEATLTR